MEEVCAEEGVSTEKIFFILLFFAVIYIIMTILEKKPKQECWRHRFLVWKKTAYRNSRGYIAKGGNF